LTHETGPLPPAAEPSGVVAPPRPPVAGELPAPPAWVVPPVPEPPVPEPTTLPPVLVPASFAWLLNEVVESESPQPTSVIVVISVSEAHPK
jgi:hypothetical protein